MPAEYLDFLMQFATGHELSYRQTAVNRIHHFVSSQKYSSAVKEAREVTINILEKTKAKNRPRFTHLLGGQELLYTDSALAWDLALELEQVSPPDALEALKIVFFEPSKKQCWSYFGVMAMDKFCDISLKLFIEGGRKNLKLLEEALDVSLQRLETISCLSAVQVFVKLIEEASGLVIDKIELSKLALILNVCIVMENLWQ